jgi:hypothetical protein
MNLDQQSQKSLQNYDWESVKALLLNHNDNDEDLRTRTIEFLDLMFRDGYLIMKRPSTSQSKRRDGFVASLRKFLEAHQLGSLFDESLFVTALNTEKAYHAILDAFAATTVGLSADEAVWTAIAIFNAQACHISTAATDVAKGTEPIIDPVNRKLPIGPDGLEVNPDDVLPALMSNLANALKMFAYRNEWFDQTGQLVVPDPINVGEDASSVGGRISDLATIWGELARADATCRYFGGQAILKNDGATTGGRQVEVMNFSFAENHDIDLHISANRRMTKLFGCFAEFHRMSLPAELFKKTPLPLSPRGFVDHEEAVSAFTLSDCLNKPIHDIQTRFAGLTLSEWIRGYAVLAKLAREAIKKHKTSACVVLDDAYLAKVLIQHGLGSQEAAAFVQRVTFWRDAVDMADTPLIRCANGKLCFVCGMAAHTNLTQAVLSQLSTHGCDLGWKGTTFEKAVLELFKEHGLESHHIDRKIGDEEIEIDCVLLWGEFLFVFELKNRSLPSDNPQNEYWFLNEQAKHRQQVLAKVAALSKYPILLTDAFGRVEDWDKLTVVPVVLNALPYSLIGQRDGVYMYDASALHRFLDTGKVGLAEVTTGPIAETQVSLWEGATPSPVDLMKQLEAPIQVTRLRDLYSVTDQAFEIDEFLTLSIPIIERSTADIRWL